MPFQHINNEVLKEMNRKIDRAQIENKIWEIQKHLPDLAWRTTFIVGFPTEKKIISRNYLSLFQEEIFCMLEYFHTPMKIISVRQNWEILFQILLSKNGVSN